MGKNKKEKPELTLENLNRAIRTYQREEVLYLIQHGILKDIPEDEKTATYQQLVSLQNMEILQSVARQIRKFSVISPTLHKAKYLSTSA